MKQADEPRMAWPSAEEKVRGIGLLLCLVGGVAEVDLTGTSRGDARGRDGDDGVGVAKERQIKKEVQETEWDFLKAF